MTTSLIGRRALWLASTTLIAFTVPAFANETTPADDQSITRQAAEEAALRRNDKAGAVETVVVTANKRSESAQKVPTALSVVSGSALERQEIRSAGDVVRFIPNASAAQTESRNRPRWFIRGIGSNDPAANVVNPVGVYVDEVYLNAPWFQAFPAFDLDRVEVLRGPQGTLWGKNTVGGAIHYVSRKPQFTPGGFARVGLGNFDSYNAQGAVTGPLSETLAARLSFSTEKRGGIATNTVTGEDDFGKVSDSAVRFQLLYRPNDDFEALLSLRARNSDGTPIARYIEPAYPDNATFKGASAGFDDYGNAATKAPDVGASNVDGSSKTDQTGATLTLNWSRGDYTLTSITAADNGRQVSKSDGDFTPFEGSRSYADIESRQFTQEFRLTSPRADRFNWIAGFHYFWEDFSSDSSTATTQTTAYLDRGTGAQRWRHTYFQNVKYDQEAKSYALFGSGTWNITDRFSITGGLRYTSEQRDATINIFNGAGEAATRRGNTVNPANTPTAAQPLVTFTNPGQWWLRSSVTATTPYAPFVSSPSKTWNRWTWDITPQYKLSDDILIYAKHARGFRSGTFQASATQSNQFDPNGIEPEDLYSYEGGLKSQWWDKKLRLNLSAFYYDYKKAQVLVQGVPIVTGGTTAFAARLINAQGWSRGIELDLSARPTTNLRIDAALGTLDTEYTDNFIPNNPNTGQLFGKGNEFTRAPKFSGTVAVEYRIPTDFGDVTLQSDWSYRTSQWFTVNAQEDDPSKLDYLVSQYQRQKGYALGNARITAAFGDRYEVSAYVRNLTDETYKILTFGTQQGARLTTYGDPRTFGVTLAAKF
ncbi:TonB-dependent receptor [Asticcacaulis excentricus]|uniref:Outer membrane receptor proteins, mostly Fe transport n=1 Tax=Asticcacaulis excentricus TaxID=78587 RepID=A0A3G9GAS3_9CAUL|nr:TonB-dependent receptor [Asticcacaulis excentricus]BBF81558.1 outer membrane receptor proteins, mostly Fe transport [Asticcacaulis excentricus]